MSEEKRPKFFNTELEMKDIIDNLDSLNPYFPIDVTREALERLVNPEIRTGLNFYKINENGEKEYTTSIQISSENRPILQTAYIPEEYLINILPHYIYQQDSDETTDKILDRYKKQSEKEIREGKQKMKRKLRSVK